MKHVARLVCAALCICVMSACGGAPKVPAESNVNETKEKSDSEAIRGVAANAKGGAVIVLDTGEVIYLDGVDSWPAEIEGKRVVAHGKLEKGDYLPDPVVSDDGAMSTGAEGLEWILRTPTWKAE